MWYNFPWFYLLERHFYIVHFLSFRCQKSVLLSFYHHEISPEWCLSYLGIFNLDCLLAWCCKENILQLNVSFSYINKVFFHFKGCLFNALIQKVNLPENFADITQVPTVDLECRLNCYYLSYAFLIFLLDTTMLFDPKRTLHYLKCWNVATNLFDIIKMVTNR